MSKIKQRIFPAIWKVKWHVKIGKNEHTVNGLEFVGSVLVLIALSAGATWLFQWLNLTVEQTGVKHQNRLLQEENQLYQEQLSELKRRLNNIEDISKELSQSLNTNPNSLKAPASGGPATGTETELFDHLINSTAHLENQLRDLKLDLERKKLAQAMFPQGLPVQGRLSDGFGTRRNPLGDGYEYHAGQDIATDFGTPVYATAEGIVVYAAAYNGYGNVVVIDHGNEITTRYGHLSSVAVRAGEHIKRGDKLGQVGSTGRSTGPHVHYELRKANVPVDPLTFKQ